VDAAARAAATLGTDAPGALRIEGNPRVSLISLCKEWPVSALTGRYAGDRRMRRIAPLRPAERVVA
jgi:hypothetical protein